MAADGRRRNPDKIFARKRSGKQGTRDFE